MHSRFKRWLNKKFRHRSSSPPNASMTQRSLPPSIPPLLNHFPSLQHTFDLSQQSIKMVDNNNEQAVVSADSSTVDTAQKSNVNAPQSENLPASTSSEPKMNGNPQPASTVAKQNKEEIPAAAVSAAGGEQKLSNAELKKKAKAEKAARRVREKEEREKGANGAAQTNQQQQQAGPSKKGGQGAKGGGSTQTPKKDKQAGPTRSLPVRQGSGQSSTQAKKSEKDDKVVAVFDHLASQKRRSTISGAGKDIHPAILALGLQMTDYVICGSSARCVAMLLALKRVSLFVFLFNSGASV